MPSLSSVAWDMMVVATGPVASVGVNSDAQFRIRDVNASAPRSAAQLTSQRTISRRRQFNAVKVMRVT